MAERLQAAVGTYIHIHEYVADLEGGGEVKRKTLLVYLGQDGERFFIGFRENRDGQASQLHSETATYKNPSSDGPTVIRYGLTKFKETQIYSLSLPTDWFG